MYVIGYELDQLKRRARISQQHAFADGTFSNLNTQWVKFLSFCVHFSLTALPATTPTLVWYTQYLSEKTKAHATVVNYLSGIKTLHELLGYSTVGFRGVMLKLTLQGLRRLNKHIPRKARPMTPRILKEMYAVLQHNVPEDAVFWLICNMAFFLLFRKSNLVPDSSSGFDCSKQLRVQDCQIVDSRLVVGIRWAKNVQFSRELLTFPLPRLPGSVLCPVRAYANVMSLFPHSPENHLFVLPGVASFTYRQFHAKLRQTLQLIGINNSQHYSSHSFRRGGCTFSFLSGVPTEMIQLLGNWKSQAFLSYLEFPLETRTAACQLMKLRLLAMEKSGAL